MLARTADSLFWLGRYMERAGNVARGLNVSLRMTAFAAPRGTETAEWTGFLAATGTGEHYVQLYGQPTPSQTARWLTLEPLNPSSIASCFEAARRNARAVRSALTVDMWEAVNDSWIDLQKLGPGDADGDHLAGFLDWVGSRAVLFNGAALDTMLRDDAWRFVRLGTMLERADNTARILASRWHAFSAEAEVDPASYVQWQGLLRSLSALTAYRHMFRDRLRPARVVEMLIMRTEHPRSLAACYEEVSAILGVLAMSDGQDSAACRRLASALRGRCVAERPTHLLDGSLADLLDELIEGNARLGVSIGKCFMIG